MHALVTGAAGFIGSHLTERLIAEGHRVRGVDCLTPYYDIRQKVENLRVLSRLSAFQWIEADLRSTNLADVLDGIDVVFHQAGQPGVRESWASGFGSYVEHNIQATQRLLEAARSTDLQRFVFASSSSVYGNALSFPTDEEDVPRPHSPYGVTKLASEHLCAAYASNWGVPTISLRYFTVFGPRQRPDMAMHRLVAATLAGEPFPVFGDGRQVRDFTYVDDVVRANLLAASADVQPGTVINVAGGTQATLLEIARIIEAELGRPALLEIRPGQPGDVDRTAGSIERAKMSLGWRPVVPLRDGLARQVAWHLKRAAVRPATL